METLIPTLTGIASLRGTKNTQLFGTLSDHDGPFYVPAPVSVEAIIVRQ